MEKVYLEVTDSDIFYRYLDFKFYFSSRAVRERFIRKLTNFVNVERLKFTNKYNIVVEDESFNLLFAFILYAKTEKRGFKVQKYRENIKVSDINKMPLFSIWRRFFIKRGDKKWLKQRLLNGVKKMKRI